MKLKRICEAVSDFLILGGAVCVTRGAFIINLAFGWCCLGLALFLISYLIYAAAGGRD